MWAGQKSQVTLLQAAGHPGNLRQGRGNGLFQVRREEKDAHNATGMLEQRCTNGTNMLDYVLGQTGGTEDVNQLLDDLKSRMGCEFTIFEGNTRAYTTI